MTEKPNWADKASLASNVLQNIQLHGLQSSFRTLGEMEAEKMRLALSEQQTQENEDRLREHVWQMENAFIPLAANPEITPSAKYVVAKQIQSSLAQFNVTTASFRRFDDKDRLGGFIRRLQQAMEAADRQISARQKADMETYLRYGVEVRELSELMELETARQSAEQAVQKKSVLKPKIDELRQKKEAIQVECGKTPGQRLVYLGLPFGLAFVLVVLALTMIGMSDDENFAGMSAGDLAGAAFGSIMSTLFFGTFFALVFKWIREGLSPQTKIANGLQAEIERLEKEMAQLDAWERNLSIPQPRRLELLKKFGASNAPDLLKQKQERDVFMEQFRLANSLPRDDSPTE
ncbi:MAG TPA: hypothetical protein VG077_07115 [Verrucomicrobiae bacterium]|nr:hypothetical protein [Verrucomicrobiae bacterium]